jgi:hypothetical protein
MNVLRHTGTWTEIMPSSYRRGGGHLMQVAEIGPQRRIVASTGPSAQTPQDVRRPQAGSRKNDDLIGYGFVQPLDVGEQTPNPRTATASYPVSGHDPAQRAATPAACSGWPASIV